MIICCTNCNKKFEINSDLIPDSGRLLVCRSCNNQWFYTKEKLADNTTQVSKKRELFSKADNKITDFSDQSENEENIDLNDINKNLINDENINLSEISENLINEEDVEDKVNLKNNIDTKNKLKPNLLSIVLVFIISCFALIILVDTFKSPISMIFPNIELILFNFYETLKDIYLFSKDLIR